jgi:tyrosyl-tRNA synthetase
VPEMRLNFGTRSLHVLLTETAMAKSRSDAERLIKQGAVEINGKVEKDLKRQVVLNPGEVVALRVGKKKFLRAIGVS